MDGSSKVKSITLVLTDWMIGTFFLYFRIFALRGLKASIIMVSIPIALNLSCLFIFLFYLLAKGLLFKTGFIGIGILYFINYAVVNTLLEKEYVRLKRKTLEINGALYYLFPPLYFVGSVYLFIYFFRFL